MLILCLKIFLVRIIDVSLGTIRMILLIKGRKFTAALVSFVEIGIWFAIVREALSTSNNSIFIIIAYAGGFATGTIVGSLISEKFIQGNFSLQIITDQGYDIVKILRESGFAVSTIDVKGKDEDNNKIMLFIEIDKKKLSEVQNIVKSIDQKAFIVVNETKLVQNGFIKK